MFGRGYGGRRSLKNHEKHVQSTYLDEYLWFKKKLVEKCCLAAEIGKFPPGFFFSHACNAATEHLIHSAELRKNLGYSFDVKNCVLFIYEVS